MVKVKKKLADIEGFKPFSSGTFRSTLMECEEGTSGAGNPKAVFTWELQEGPDQGRQIKSHPSLMDDALSSWKEHMLALGADPDDEDVDTDDYLGEDAMLTLSQRKYRDRETGEERTTTDVKRVSPVEDEDDKPKRKAKSKTKGEKKSKAKGKKSSKRGELPFA